MDGTVHHHLRGRSDLRSSVEGEGGQGGLGGGLRRIFEGPDYERTRREVLRRLFGSETPKSPEPPRERDTE